MMDCNLEKILPHKPPMILIDNVLDYIEEKQALVAEFRVDSKKIFFDKTLNGINSLVGIEIMAQAVGCYSYFKNGSKKPSCGLLLGSRLFNNSLDCFKNNETYTIFVHEIFTDNELASFDCVIKDKNGNEIQSAGLNVCIVESFERILQNENR